MHQKYFMFQEELFFFNLLNLFNQEIWYRFSGFP